MDQRAELALAPKTTTLWVRRRPSGSGPGPVLRISATTSIHEGAFASRGAFAAAMCFDGSELWLVDYVSGARRFRRLATDGRVLVNLPLPFTSPALTQAGLAGDSDHLYFAEHVANRNTGERGSRIVEFDPTTWRVLRVAFGSTAAMFDVGPVPATLTNLSAAGAVSSTRQEATGSSAAQRLGDGLAAGRNFLLSLYGNRVLRYETH